MNKLKTLLLSASTLVLLAACGGTTEEEPATTGDNGEATTEQTTEDTASEETFTTDDLSEYDGQDGSDAYVAVDGTVYDVTGNDAWTDGEHQGEQLAGTDATDVIAESPHGDSVLEDLEVVGTLEE